VALFDFDSNKYQTIIHQKRKLLLNHNTSEPHIFNCKFSKSNYEASTTIIPTDKTLRNKKIDEFGEMAVERLMQPYRRKFYDDEIEQIIADYKSGKTTIELAKEFNCNKNTINILLRKHGVNVAKAKAQAKLDIDEVIKMYEDRNTIEKIAKHFGVSSHTINKCLHKNNVKIRGRWDYTDK